MLLKLRMMWVMVMFQGIMSTWDQFVDEQGQQKQDAAICWYVNDAKLP